MKRRYLHLFFDLDRTLWDFDRNSLETLEELFQDAGLQEKGVPGFEAFIETYHKVNDGLWALYRKGEMSREVLSAKRFRLTFSAFGYEDDGFSHWFGEEYLRRAALRDHTFEGAREVLDYLQHRYTLHILTNGFAEVQYNKLRRSGLRKYFMEIISSEEVGISKPEPGIFTRALAMAGAEKQQSLMIGDDLKVDIIGAMEAGIDQVWFNPGGLAPDIIPTYEIRRLEELMNFL